MVQLLTYTCLLNLSHCRYIQVPYKCRYMSAYRNGGGGPGDSGRTPVLLQEMKLLSPERFRWKYVLLC